MINRHLVICLMAAMSVAFLAATASAAGIGIFLDPIVTIPTNDGVGADAEVRESEANRDDSLTSPDPDFVFGRNRGNNEELATRVASNRSSAMYMQFDITSLPGSGDPFWNGKEVAFRGFARQGGNFRMRGENQVTGELEDLILRVRALDPNGTYSTSQTDQNGNAYTATQYQYEWNEGTGTSPPDVIDGITAYNAPGRQPFCIDNGSCDPQGTIGMYDEFDLDPNIIDLDNIPMPGAHEVVADAGQQFVYLDDTGDLTQLVKDAKDAGRESVTLIVHNGHDINDPGTPTNFLGRNDIFAPKERTTVIDTDDNLNGAFSPQLLVIPEPSSLVLISLASLAVLGVRRK